MRDDGPWREGRHRLGCRSEGVPIPPDAAIDDSPYGDDEWNLSPLMLRRMFTMIAKSPSTTSTRQSAPRGMRPLAGPAMRRLHTLTFARHRDRSL
jgi:hypothetical protein